MILVDESDPIDEVEPTFPYREVNTRRGLKIREAYEVLDEIGRGKFGRVFRCKDRESGLVLAAKVVSTKRKEERRNVEREIEIMKKLQHPRLIQLYDAIEDLANSEMCLVLEMVGGGELFDRVIQDEFVLTERACAVFVRQISEAVEYIHSQNILHLDMKPENVMCLSKKGNRIKIIDFGLARFYDPNKKLQVLFGTPEFVAPEVVNFEAIDYATDMWSVGVITYVLLSGLSPFMGETDVETMANVTIAKYDFDDECFDDISDDAKDFISKLLMKDKKLRSTAVQLLQHPWLRNNRKVRLETKKLKRYVVKKRWAKAFNAIVAIRRMGLGFKLFNTSQSDGDVQNGSGGAEASAPPVSSDRKTSESSQSVSQTKNENSGIGRTDLIPTC